MVFTELCNHHYYLIFEHFHHPQKLPHPPLAVTPPPLPQALATTNPVSVSVDLPVLDISHKRNYTLCVLLCLASLIEQHGLKTHSCCSECQCFTPFYDWIHDTLNKVQSTWLACRCPFTALWICCSGHTGLLAQPPSWGAVPHCTLYPQAWEPAPISSFRSLLSITSFEEFSLMIISITELAPRQT